MNGFCVGYHSDLGNTHSVNQDSIFIKSFSNSEQRVLVAGLFDGMGGYSEGERVSGAAAQAVSNWANSNKVLLFEEDVERITQSLSSELDRLNNKIRAFGKRAGIDTGTTAAILIIWKDRFLCCNVGDSRIYHISAVKLKQITEDHSLVADLVRAGLLSEEQAKTHPQKNVLTQALGVLEKIKPSFQSDYLKANDAFLLCCDGFYHELSEDDILRLYDVDAQSSAITQTLEKVTNLVLSRGETDNITSILIKTTSEG